MKRLIFFLLVISLCIASVSALTPDGSVPAGDNMLIFTYVVFLIATVGLFATLFLTLAKIVTFEETVYGVLTTISFYILLIIVNHMTAHYVEDVFIYDLTNTFSTITRWTNVVLPLVGLVISIVMRSLQKKSVLSVKEINGRFFSRG